MSQSPAPGLVSDGKALPHTSLVSADFTVDAVSTTILIVTNPGNAGTVASLTRVDASGATIGSTQLLTIPTLALDDSAGGPSASRAMKFSASVVNCTNALKRGGRVTYINSSQRLPARDSAGSNDPIIQGIKDSPYRKRINGEMLTVPLQLIGYPVDHTSYERFRPHRGTLDAAQFEAHALGASATTSISSRSMSIIVYVFDPTVDTQDYSVTIRGSFYTRWPMTSVPGQSMKHMPTSTAEHINHVHKHTEETANDLVHVVEGGALATIGPRVMPALRTVGGAMARGIGRLAGASQALEAGAVEVFGAEAVELAPLMLL